MAIVKVSALPAGTLADADLLMFVQGGTSKQGAAGQILDAASYSVSWTGGTPAIGNGTLVGSQISRGDVVIVNITLTAGTTTTFGSGIWSFSLPAGVTAARACIGEASAYDSSATTWYNGLAVVASGATTVQVYGNAATDGFKSSLPMTWATSDTLTIQVLVQK